MGSRIVIDLQDVTGSTSVDVLLVTKDTSDDHDDGGITFESNALVVFKGRGAQDFKYTFTFFWDQGKPKLEADFNFPRYAPDAIQVRLMRKLYEHSIGFTIHH